ncbi:MAG: DUF4433 domain-containing protein [Thermomicrobiales bacterium]|nr:DUF4433 domain-containing protein [Thermomicrobiales bacterium]
MPRKPDDAAIAVAVDRLSVAAWLQGMQRDWPGFLFHVTDVHNARSILSMGRLLCREVLQDRGIAGPQTAAPRIIATTAPWVHQHVRLYFRPRTPTRWRNEGIRPRGEIWQGAHCPVPVALLFDAKSILGMAGSAGLGAISPPAIRTRGSARPPERLKRRPFPRSIGLGLQRLEKRQYGRRRSSSLRNSRSMRCNSSCCARRPSASPRIVEDERGAPAAPPLTDAGQSSLFQRGMDAGGNRTAHGRRGSDRVQPGPRTTGGIRCPRRVA